MSDVFHLNLTKAQLKGATLAIVPGDPARSERIAKNLITLSFLQVHVSSLLGEAILMVNQWWCVQPVLVALLRLSVWKSWLSLACVHSCVLVQQVQFNHISM